MAGMWTMPPGGLTAPFAFFMPGIYIAESRFETVMFHKPHEIICHRTGER
jgi:hypothetical protein